MFSIGEKVRVLSSNRVGTVERVNDAVPDEAVVAVRFADRYCICHKDKLYINHAPWCPLNPERVALGAELGTDNVSYLASELTAVEN